MHEALGGQSGRVSAVPDAYEDGPLEPCKVSARQRQVDRPARNTPRRERGVTPPHPSLLKKILGEYNSAEPSWANLPKANVAEDLRMSLCDFAELAHAPILSKKGPLAESRGRASGGDPRGKAPWWRSGRQSPLAEDTRDTPRPCRFGLPIWVWRCVCFPRNTLSVTLRVPPPP